MGQYMSIQGIGLGQSPGRFGKVSDLSGVYHGHRQLHRCQSGGQRNLQAACCFHHYPSGPQVLQLGDKKRDLRFVIRRAPTVPAGSHGNVHSVLGDVDPYVRS